MRVLHLAPRPDAGTGISTYAARFRGALREHSVDVIQLAAPADVLNSIGDINAYARLAVGEARRGYDLVHAEVGGAALREFYASAVLERRTKLPVFLTLHDPPRPVWWPFHTHLIKQWRIAGAGLRRATAGPANALERSTLHQAAGSFVLSHAGVTSVERTFGLADERKVHFLPFPIEPSALVATRPDDDPLRVGFFGYWYPGKGLELLVSALAALRGEGRTVRAQLWGDISPSAGTRPGMHYRQAVMAAVRRAGIVDAVEVLGFLDSQDVTASLQSCDVVVLPYERPPDLVELKSTSASMYEALAAGVPVIAADVKALGEVVSDGVNGHLFPSGDADALVGVLRRLDANRDHRRRLREGARRSAASFSKTASAQTAIAVYESALDAAR